MNTLQDIAVFISTTIWAVNLYLGIYMVGSETKWGTNRAWGIFMIALSVGMIAYNFINF